MGSSILVDEPQSSEFKNLQSSNTIAQKPASGGRKASVIQVDSVIAGKSPETDSKQKDIDVIPVKPKDIDTVPVKPRDFDTIPVKPRDIDIIPVKPKASDKKVYIRSDDMPIPTLAKKDDAPGSQDGLNATEDTEELSETFKIEYEIAIRMFGLSPITNLHSRKFPVREAALEEIVREIESNKNKKEAKDMASASCQVMQMTMGDSVDKIVSSGYKIWKNVTEIVKRADLNYSTIYKSVEPLIPNLIIKAGETNPRLRKVIRSGIINIGSH
jgi:hypothetical protein